VQEAELDALADLIVATLRTQFVAIIGNVLAAMPVSFMIAWIIQAWQGSPVVGAEKAMHLLADIDPFHSLALFHAAIAGVCLFLAGLISGYYDNLALYNRIPARIQQLGWLNRLLGRARTIRFAEYMAHNTGALAGNFFFGIMLGCMGTLGFIFGLPIDIRHVTFSSANFSYALVALDYQVPWQTWLISLVGIGLIGMTNLAVSFSLALTVALKARRVRFTQSRRLLFILWTRLRHRPRDFVLPPPG
jgi:site-specific recombinase